MIGMVLCCYCPVRLTRSSTCLSFCFFFFFQAEDGIRDPLVTGVQTCALPIYHQDFRVSPDVVRDVRDVVLQVPQPPQVSVEGGDDGKGAAVDPHGELTDLEAGGQRGAQAPALDGRRRSGDRDPRERIPLLVERRMIPTALHPGQSQRRRLVGRQEIGRASCWDEHYIVDDKIERET